jgi:Flp pilus assembly protein TadG
MSKRFGVASQSLVHKLRHYFSNQSGQVALTTGLAAVPLFMMGAAAIEMERYNSDKAHFQVAVDTAALAVARDPGADASKVDYDALKTVAHNYIKTNFPGATDITKQNIELTVTSTDVVLGVTHNHSNIFSGFLGNSTIPMTASTKITKGGSKIELVLVMDVTGSMKDYMSSAKTAAKNLLKNLYGDKTTTSDVKIRVSVVPFSGSVRLNVAPKKDSTGNVVKDANGNITYANDFKLDWIDTSASNPLSTLHFRDPVTDAAVTGWSNYEAYKKLGLSWNGCVEARSPVTSLNSTDYQNSDEPPLPGTGASLFPAYFVPDSPSSSSNWGSWPYNYIGGDTTSVTFAKPTPPQEKKCLNWSCSQYNMVDIAFSSDSWPSVTAADKAKWFTYWGKLANNYKKYTTASGSVDLTDVETNCPAAKSVITPMTYSRTAAETAIDALASGGNTNIPEGLAWGWRAISPGEPFTKVAGVGTIGEGTIANYNDRQWNKVIVLMTDGDNTTSNGYSYVGSKYNANGFALDPAGYNRSGVSDVPMSSGNHWNEAGWTATMDSNMSRTNEAMPGLCKAIKDKGVQIYTVAFNMPSGTSTTKTLLQNCSSNASTNYYDAANTTALDTAFSAIGAKLRETVLYVAR